MTEALVLLGRLVTFDPARPEVEDAALYIVWIRAVAPNGQYGDGYCSADEGRFKSWKA